MALLEKPFPVKPELFPNVDEKKCNSTFDVFMMKMTTSKKPLVKVCLCIETR